MKPFIVMTSLFFTPILHAVTDTSTSGLNQAYQSITAHALKAEQSCHALSQAIPSASSEKQKLLFKNLIKTWKIVESEYILSEFDSEMIDIPRYLDTFHYNTNQPLQPQIEKSLGKKTSAENALFKNAFKSINALEYVLYSHPKTDLQQSYVKKITQTICEHLNGIHQSYTSNEKNILSHSSKLEGILLNTLIDSSYKLREWRIGDVIGQSKKYKNKFNANRAEYAESQLSIFAIHHILLNHQVLMGEKGLLSSLLKNEENTKILDTINSNLEHALKITTHLQDKGFNKENKAELESLYQYTEALQKAYYEKLLGTLNITSKILEADGD